MPVTSSPPAQPSRVPTLIVLPFRMLRPGPETEFLASSLHDALTGSLGGPRHCGALQHGGRPLLG